MKVGDLVRMKETAHFEKWWGLTAIIHGASETDAFHNLLIDVCFVNTNETRLGMSASLFEIINEAS